MMRAPLARPCFRELREEANLPVALVGPVEYWALARLISARLETAGGGGASIWLDSLADAFAGGSGFCEEFGGEFFVEIGVGIGGWKRGKAVGFEAPDLGFFGFTVGSAAFGSSLAICH